MADVFGDLDLFSEFNKEREASASYIHYDEDTVKSRIVFEDFESEKESESEDDFVEDTDIKYDHAEKEPAAEEQPNAQVSEESENSTAETQGYTTQQIEQMEEVSNEKAQEEQLYPKDDGSSDMVIDNTANMTTDMTMVTDMSMGMTDMNEMKDETAAYYMQQGYEGMMMDETYGYGYSYYNEYEYKKPEVEIKLSAEDEAKIAFLNEQLHAEAAEEAKKPDISVSQLIFDKNRFKRYAKILDSSRYVPDDDSPAVQLLFHNNSFARKYRQQIEQFIKGLLWEEFHAMPYESSSDVLIKPGRHSCIEINDDLPPESRTEKMRQRHGIIGNSQFHKQFLIDFLGWPFSDDEPTRCNVNWEIPLYAQVYTEVYADLSNRTKKGAYKKPKPACWNCGDESHGLNDCKQPKIPSRIAANRKEMMDKLQQNASSYEPKFVGLTRYHLDPELSSRYTKFKPGVISDSLREALGLAEHQLPQHIYKMRLYGYPPGWLAEAKLVESGVTVFDKNGKVTSITGEGCEDGDVEEDPNQEKMEYDVSKIIEYPGFTIAIPPGFVDEYATYQMPPIQQHQLKETLLAQSNTEKTTPKKRKRPQEEDGGSVKKSKTESLADGEVQNGQLVTGNGIETSAGEEVTEGDNASSDLSLVATPKLMPRSSSTISLSKDYGTPILVREKIKLPDAAKFGKNIEDHIPFENLPNSTGTFEKMRDILENIKKKFRK